MRDISLICDGPRRAPGRKKTPMSKGTPREGDIEARRIFHMGQAHHGGNLAEALAVGPDFGLVVVAHDGWSLPDSHVAFTLGLLLGR